MAEMTPSGDGRGDRPLRILAALTYYRPYISGLTIYAERLARALVQRGHAVTVLTMRHDDALPPDEVVDGVRIVRAPVLARLGKGLLAPRLHDPGGEPAAQRGSPPPAPAAVRRGRVWP